MSSIPERLRLHLGCGEVFLPGYVNIDLPAADHTVQSANQATIRADITTLEYPAGTVDEIRLHHVFEHFDRPTAVYLLMSWQRWLRVNGLLVIETPDFARCARRYVLTRSMATRMRLARHIFGSHEAHWAVHYDGWDRKRFSLVLPEIGYSRLRFRTAAWCGTYNITVTAQKAHNQDAISDPMALARRILELSLVNGSPSERRLLDVWLGRVRSLLKQGEA
jgi:hypothetical protein